MGCYYHQNNNWCGHLHSQGVVKKEAMSHDLTHEPQTEQICPKCIQGKQPGKIETSKPTARERFERIKKEHSFWGECEPGLTFTGEQVGFFISLVEAAITDDYRLSLDEGPISRESAESYFWERIDQRLSQAEGKGAINYPDPNHKHTSQSKEDCSCSKWGQAETKGGEGK